MNSAAFIAGLPIQFHPLRNSIASAAEGKKNTSPLRPPPKAVTDGPDDSKANGDDGQLGESRAAMERLFILELTPKGKNRGQCKCIWCEGTKQRKCSWCEGKGYRHEMIKKTWEELSRDIERMQKSDEPVPLEEPQRIPVTCSACSGTKKLRCAYCRGSGTGSYGHAY